MRCSAVVVLSAASWLLACGAPPEPPQTPVVEEGGPSAAGADTPASDVATPAEAPLDDPAPSANPSDPAAGAESAKPDAAPAPDATGGVASTPASTDSAPAAAPPPPGNTVKETRTISVIRDVVLKNRQGVRDCYDAARRRNPKLGKGTLTLHFKIDPKGKVSFAQLNLERSTLNDTALVGCAIKAVQRIPFPPSSRGFESEVNYPFDLKP